MAPISSHYTPATQMRSAPQQGEQLRELFTQFVGETFFGQMIKAMRSTVGKPAYFHGGRAEEVFRGQLDQTLAEHMAQTSAENFTREMFEQQFPHLAAGPRDAGSTEALDRTQLDRLDQLARR